MCQKKDIVKSKSRENLHTIEVRWVYYCHTAGQQTNSISQVTNYRLWFSITSPCCSLNFLNEEMKVKLVGEKCWPFMKRDATWWRSYSKSCLSLLFSYILGFYCTACSRWEHCAFHFASPFCMKHTKTEWGGHCSSVAESAMNVVTELNWCLCKREGRQAV